jgi:hypothetical protein
MGVSNYVTDMRLRAIAAVFDGNSRDEAAKIGGLERQILRDWVIRFKEREPRIRIEPICMDRPCVASPM